MARRYASRKRSYGRKTKRGAVRKRSYRRKSTGSRRMVRAPRQASGSSMNGYSVFNMPFSSYGKGNSTGIGRAINDKALSRARRLNTRLGAYYKADTAYRAQVADQQKILATRAANAKRVADANFGVDLYNQIGTGLAGLANMIVPGLGVPIQAVVSGTTPAFRQLAGGDQTFRPSDVTSGLSNFAPVIPWAGAALYQLGNSPGVQKLTTDLNHVIRSGTGFARRSIMTGRANYNELRGLYNALGNRDYDSINDILGSRRHRLGRDVNIEMDTFNSLGGYSDFPAIEPGGHPDFPDIVPIPDESFSRYKINGGGNQMALVPPVPREFGFETIAQRVRRQRNEPKWTPEVLMDAPNPLVSSNPILGYRWAQPIMDKRWIPFMKQPKVAKMMMGNSSADVKNQLLERWWFEQYGPQEI